MKPEVYRKAISAKDFNRLCESVSWKTLNEKQFCIAQENSLAIVHARFGDKIIGYARVVGDKVCYLYVQDLVVDPAHQGKGVGKALLRELHSILQEQGEATSSLLLVAGKKVRGFYEKIGYKEISSENALMRCSLVSQHVSGGLE
jgi:ribosomal protein S18 acetylase RimI-like enzyme